ncbi:YbaB/EbfC family nucleoid-associated protein [Streptomyces sp. YS415]|uniref:YbaB/EbfC family nucleoid-associated protein n=1 Tax=Streptomyces sp. YS415 TaxID=2944806 RepID=UPI002020FBDF|nr:YbaB/EbfC family nucleoid-associated protein [Streptomyces sp. YS415]MCL7429416.1 YbaB/EbfC family nucleoid-associated protein [Streptomyces sp. YS415]
MSESLEKRIAEAEARLEATSKAAARIQSDLAETTETVTSRDRSVKVTVGSQGNLTGLVFLDGKHRTMSATELAGTVLETAAQARENVMRRVLKTLAPLSTGGDETFRLGDFELTLDKLLGPDAPHRPAERRTKPLHDELHED